MLSVDEHVEYLKLTRRLIRDRSLIRQIAESTPAEVAEAFDVSMAAAHEMKKVDLTLFRVAVDAADLGAKRLIRIAVDEMGAVSSIKYPFAPCANVSSQITSGEKTT